MKRKTDNIEQMSYYHRHQLPDKATQGKQVTNPNKPDINNRKRRVKSLTKYAQDISLDLKFVLETTYHRQSMRDYC
jgi:hypothetical protein